MRGLKRGQRPAAPLPGRASAGTAHSPAAGGGWAPCAHAYISAPPLPRGMGCSGIGRAATAPHRAATPQHPRRPVPPAPPRRLPGGCGEMRHRACAALAADARRALYITGQRARAGQLRAGAS